MRPLLIRDAMAELPIGSQERFKVAVAEQMKTDKKVRYGLWGEEFYENAVELFDQFPLRHPTERKQAIIKAYGLSNLGKGYLDVKKYSVFRIGEQTVVVKYPKDKEVDP